MAGKRDFARAVQPGGEVDDVRVGGIGRVFLRRVDEYVQRLVNAVDFQHIVSRAGQRERENAPSARHGDMARGRRDAGAEHVEIDRCGHGRRAVRFKRDEAGDFRFIQRALRAAEDLVDRHGGDARRAHAQRLSLGGDGVIGADGLKGHVGVKANHGFPSLSECVWCKVRRLFSISLRGDAKRRPAPARARAAVCYPLTAPIMTPLTKKR